MIALLASLLLATNATPAEVIANCRAMLPAEVTLEGRVILRNRKGIPQLERDYVYTRTNGTARVNLADDELAKLGVTPSDLTLDYLWWDDFAYDAERNGESVQGLACTVLVLRKGERTVRVWVERKYGAVVQAEECEGDRTVRRLWGTRLKKFGDRWMARELEVEKIGSGLRTKITVEKLK